MSSGGGLVKIAGIDKRVLRDFVEMDVDPAAWERFLSRRNAALLGCDFVTTFRDRYVWEVGKDFVMAEFHDLSLYMAGVFTPRDPTYRNVILTDRVFLQEVDDKRGIANHIFVELAGREHTVPAIAAIEALDYPVAIRAESAQVALDQAVEDLNDMLAYARYVILFMGLLMVLCLANTISMSVHDRTQELGVLRSLGFDRLQVLAVVIAESLALGLLGGAAGCLAAYAVLNVTGHQLALRGITIQLELRPALLLAALGASLLVGLLSGVLPAVGAARRPIVEAVRKTE